MKKVLALTVMIACLLGIAAAATPVCAASPWDDNFDDNVMDTGLWEHVYLEDDPATFREQNQRLDWFVNGAQMDEGQYITDKYVSTWQYDLSGDMVFQVDFLHQVSANNGTGMNMGLYSGDVSAGDVDFQALIGFRNTVDPAVNNGTKTLTYNWAVSGDGLPGGSGWFPRTNTNGTGTLFAAYDHDLNRLQLYGSNGPKINISVPLNVTSLGVYLEGWASGGTTIVHNASSYFDNFSAAPEPVSFLLFGIGGLAMAGARRFGRKK